MDYINKKDMKKYKVKYTVYDNNEWRSRDETTIVEATSEEEAKNRVNGYSDYCEYFMVKRVEEIKD